jgi:4-oxalmesaconate hydratase
VFFDTCVYHQPGIDLLARVIPVDNILFASEMLGAVKGIDPESGHAFDDTRRYVEALPLSPADKEKIFSGNAKRVYPGLAQVLARRERRQAPLSRCAVDNRVSGRPQTARVRAAQCSVA